jgi:2-phospho-L-lactate guanylyltransferase
MRGIAEGKSRLASVLEPPERARLNEQLLARTLEVVAGWRGDLNRCVVVSPCQRALVTAARLGAATLLEGADSGGLNAAAALGASYARQRDANGVLILPCDLPHLTPDALGALTDAAATTRHMVIAPDSAKTGTNALLICAPERFEFHFGERSFEHHTRLAAERGYAVSICSRPELEFDLDTPEDLADWRRATGTPAETALPR